MKRILIVILILLAVPAAASALTDGITLAAPDNRRCVNADLGDQVTVNVVITCPSHAEILGLELGLDVTGAGTTFWNFTPPSMDGCFPEPDNFYATWDPPLPRADLVFPVTIEVFYLDSGPVTFRLRAAEPSSFDGLGPGYPFDMEGGLQVLTRLDTGADFDFAINLPECGAAAFAEPDCPTVPDARTTWGSIKSLYR